MDNKTKIENVELIQTDTKEIISVNSSFNLSLNIPKDLIIPFKSYFSLFPRYCLTIKEFIVEFKVTEREETLLFEFGYGVNNQLGIDELEKHFSEFINLIRVKSLYVCLKRRANRISDNNSFHKFCMRLEEEIRHLNRVVYLEIGLKRILELPERTSVNVKFDDELVEVKDAMAKQYEDYTQLVKYIEAEKENKYLLKENERLKNELQKVDEERKKLIDELLKVVHSKFDKVGNAMNNAIDKTHIKNLIINDKIYEVFDLLNLLKDDVINMEVILLNRRWNDNERNKRLDIERVDEYMIEKQKILKGILEIIKKI